MTETPSFDGPRRIRLDELRDAHRLAQICFNDLPQDEEPEGPPAAPPHLREDGETHVIAAGGKPVSLISIFHEKLVAFDAVLNTGNIGGVCTHPSYRGYGLATRLLEHCAARLVDGGAHLMIISGERGLYQRSGNAPVGRYAGFTVRPGQMRDPGVRVTLRTACPEDAALCSRLYQSEPVRYQRKLPIFQHFLTRERWGYHQETFIIEMDGRLAAYLFLTQPWEHMGHPELGLRGTCEFAGSRVALSAALYQAINQLSLKEILVPVPWQDVDFFQLLRAAGVEMQWIHLPDHTMRVINLPGLMNDLRGYIAARLDASLRRGLRFEQSGPLLGHKGGDVYRISRGKDSLELNGWDLTRLVMGDPGAPVSGPGALAEILPALFPLPAFHPGLNYH